MKGLNNYLCKLGIDKHEAKSYIKKFRQADYFAVIKVGGECLNGTFIEAVRFLHDSHLYPVIIHGAGPQIDKALETYGIPIKKKNGLRVTDEETLEVVIETQGKINRGLVRTINKDKAKTMSVVDVSRIIQAKPHPDRELKYVGEVQDIDIDVIKICLGFEIIPMSWSIGYDANGQPYNVNADSVAAAIASKLKFEKIIFLTEKGGVFNLKNGTLISQLNQQRLEELIAKGDVNGGMLPKLEETKKLLEAGHDIQIASPKNLIYELFTKKGKGTYISA